MPNPAKANIYTAFTIMLQIAAAVAILFIDSNTDAPTAFKSLLSAFISLLLPFAIYLTLSGLKVSQVLRLKPLNYKNIGLIITMSITIQAPMMLVSGFSSLFFKNGVSGYMGGMLKESSVLVTVLSAAVMPALFEEISFRGAAAYDIKNISPLKACLLNGLYFALMHLDLQQFLYTFLLGAVMYTLVISTESIYASMLMHFIINFSQILLLYLFEIVSVKSPASAVPVSSDMQAYQAVMPIIILAISTAVFASSFVHFLKINKANKGGNETLMDKSLDETAEHLAPVPDKILTPSFVLTFSMLIFLYIFIITQVLA